MEQSQSITKLAAALVAAQSQLKPVARTSENPFFHSRYADLGAVWDGCREVLKANGLAILQTPANGNGAIVITKDKKGNDVAVTSIGITTMLIHVSGEWIRETGIYPVANADAQGAGSAITYGRRYGLAAILGMVTEDDDDGNSASTPDTKHAGKSHTQEEGVF